MKKIVLVLALVLSLVLCAFAFASCGKDKAKSTTATPKTTAGTTECAHEWNTEYTVDTPSTCAREGSKSIRCSKCGAQKPGSVETVEKLAHTPGEQFIVDLEPNCREDGAKSKHCVNCGAIVTETIVTLDADPSRHVVEEWTVTTPATLLNQTGARTGECTVCHDPVNEVLTFEPTVLVCDDTSGGGYPSESIYFEDILGDKHFYPTTEDPAGNDLLIEYSILWNETLLDLYTDTDNAPYITARVNKEPVLYWSPRNDIGYSDAKFAGAFEWMGNFSKPISDSEVTTPATMCGVNPNYSDYPNIGGAIAPDADNLDNGHEWGWHRIQIRIHQELIDEAAVKAGTAGDKAEDYVTTATAYVDGVAIFKLSTGTKGLQKYEDNLFFAETDGEGGIKYEDGNAYVVAFYLNRKKAIADKTAYVVVADINVTCGKDFAMKVEKVASPAANTFTVEEEGAEPVEINAPIYFKLAD